MAHVTGIPIRSGEPIAEEARMTASGDGVESGSARAQLLTVLGELVWPAGRPAWTASLLQVMRGLGIEERTARQAIARSARDGWIRAERVGRETRWALTPELVRAFEEGTRRVASLSEPFLDWDGTWLVLFVTVPHELRAVRKRLYGRLEWAGFGNPSPGVWVSPHAERGEQLARTITELGLDGSTLSFRGAIGDIGLDEAAIVASGWDTVALAARYAAVDEEFRDLDPAPGDATLFAHLRVLGALQAFPFVDPQLPEALLPDWVGRRVTARLQELRRRWAPRVRRRWDEIDAGGPRRGEEG
jgi:phenylacetic acid degradation operon negative regulatory protein